MSAPRLTDPVKFTHNDGYADHGVRLHDIPDEFLADILPTAKKLQRVIGCEDYNMLQVRLTVPVAKREC